ncbi:iron dicitrate transport regulator FecR [Yersinia entomophaga]|uniref:Iron dicitrate transport regulator FecR n=1 Tax=Yersinia entomophaga TaxID=935293 RepID=A0ABN4PT65_YERET|nr:ferric citrate uptake sigma factor regulator FecR [Yersinia entomophaga]ANI30079.1 iron dicitrate transport regulator FecR [Yersinia entomophaga]
MSSSLSESQQRALKMAAQWFAALCDENVTSQQKQKWQLWYQQHEDHRWAWQRVEALQGQFHSMPGTFSYQTLNQARQQAEITRRRVLKGLVVFLGVGGSWKAWQSPTGQGLWADARTSTGEIKSLPLSDGSQLFLNTASAADIRYTTDRRLIWLHQGEIGITTAKDLQARPFIVETSQGWMRALGTQFIVRQTGDITQLSVLKHAVEVKLRAAPNQIITVNEGQSVSFSDRDFSALTPLIAGAGSWTQGRLSVSDGRLGDVIEDIARYRHGRLSCDPTVAELRISGTFPLKDTDRLLKILTQTLPVKVQSLTRYWVKVVPA